VPIAGGENIPMPPGCDVGRIADAPADILQPDLTKYAPLHVALRLLDTATAKGKRVVPHFLGSAPGQAASLHFAAGCGEGLVEWDINENPLRTAFFQEPFQIRDGTVEIPASPGLGWSSMIKGGST
jgi:L-alanine-DL-glutamate epimerase-like enolase superfamily enzyme